MADGMPPRAARSAPKAPTRPRTAPPSGLYPCASPAIGHRVVIEGRGPAESVAGEVLGCHRDPTTGRAGYVVGKTVSRGRVTGALRRESARAGGTWDPRKGHQQGVTRSGRGAGAVEPRALPVEPRKVLPRVEAMLPENVRERPQTFQRDGSHPDAAPKGRKAKMCSTTCTSPDCVRCCPRQIRREERAALLEDGKRARAAGAVPYPIDTTFPHAEGASRCCVEHPLWRELGVEVDEVRRAVWEGPANDGPDGARWERVEDVPDVEVVAELRRHPRWAEWESQAAKCITSLDEQLARERPKGGRGSAAVELADRRWRYLAEGGDLGSREWTDTLRATEKRQFKKYGLTTYRTNPARRDAPTLLALDAETPTVELWLDLPAGDDEALWEAIEENDWTPRRPFLLGDVMDLVGEDTAETIRRLVARAIGVESLDDMVFPDGSMLSDRESIELTILRSQPAPSGLSGSTWSFHTRVRFPDSIRYMPDEETRKNPTRPRTRAHVGRGMSSRDTVRDAWAFCRRTGRDAWVVFAVARSGHRFPMGWRADHAKALALRDAVTRASIRANDGVLPEGMLDRSTVDVIVTHAKDVRG